MEDAEKQVLAHLVAAWNAFVALPCQNHHDDNDFAQAIHDAQKVIALRVARRATPELWHRGR